MRSRRVRIALIATAAVAAGFVGQMAIANEPGGSPTPANKAIASGDSVTEIGPGAEQILLSARLKTSKPTDLMIHTSLECSILTMLETGPSTQSNAVDTARGDASVLGWIEIDDDALRDQATDPTPHRVVPIMSTSQPPQNGSTPNSGNPAEDGATYCDRTYERTEAGGERADTVLGEDGIDRETDYIRTKSANAFNWVLLNAGSGTHHVRLVGTLAADGTRGFCPTSTAQPISGAHPDGSCTEAYVGNRTMIIEPTKMANDAVISPTASS